MNKAESQISSKEKEHSFVIERDECDFRITSPYVSLAQNQDHLRFTLTVDKLPTSVEFGQNIHGIIVDNESRKLQQLRREAASLQNLPQRERIMPLLDLVSRNISYAFTSRIDLLSDAEPEKARRVREYTLNPNAPVTVSEVVDNGYGICRHFSVTMLSLAQDAGLYGAHLKHEGSKHNDQAKLLNVNRRDTGLPLFQSFGVNERFDGGHSYLDLLVDGEWVPVDPTTSLTGLTDEGLKTFKEANYKGNLDSSVVDKGLPKFVYGGASIFVLPGEKTAKGTYSVRSNDYKGPLDFRISSQQSFSTGTNVEIASIQLTMNQR